MRLLKLISLAGMLILLAGALALLPSCSGALPGTATVQPAAVQRQQVNLPPPQLAGSISVEQAINQRRSVRTYGPEHLALADLGQLLWAAQGITGPNGLCAAPSAGALYPLEVYVIAGEIDGLEPGVYHYRVAEHTLEARDTGDLRVALAKATGQDFVGKAAAAIVIAAVYSRTAAKYGDRGVRYAQLEAGHAAQNICLQATAMGLGVVTVGAFSDDQVSQLIGMPSGEQPLYIIPVGKPAN